MENIKHTNHKSENIETKYLNNTRKNKFLKVTSSLYKLGNNFIELKDGELKDRKLEIKKEIKELFFKLNIVPTYGMDRFEQNEMKKRRPIKNNWYNCLVNYIPEPIR